MLRTAPKFVVIVRLRCEMQYLPFSQFKRQELDRSPQQIAEFRTGSDDTHLRTVRNWLGQLVRSSLYGTNYAANIWTSSMHL